MNRYSLLLLSGFIIWSSCHESSSKKNLQPGIADCDSAVVMFYHQPGNPRFFDMLKIYDKDAIADISRDVNGKVIPPKDTCTTQGKLYFYGEGDAVYVVYFSRLEDCLTLSFIKTGEKYYTRMGGRVKDLLDDWRSMAITPGSD